MTDTDIEAIVALHYERGSRLWDILLTHCRSVARLAVAIAEGRPELGADVRFVREAALLHDVGIVRTDAPGIGCHGALPYICHGVAGRLMLDDAGLPRHALVCERHTGAGLTAAYIEEMGLPLPRRDMVPLFVEEKIVCYADKFYSKTRHLTQMKTWQEALGSVAKYGDESARRFLEMDALLRIPAIK